MTPEHNSGDRWSRVQALFHEALSCSPQDRSTFLDGECGDDTALRDEVLSLLASHDDGGPLGALEDDDAAVSPALEWIGPYRLLRRLGEGGMGTVYLGEREGAGFTQTVALKLIRAGYRDPQLEERLKAERRILARLEHPGIARLIDGGATPTGQPFVAMEYVEGIALIDHCDRHRLDVAERLRLFLDVCETVHYAHQQLVVHRDLKPSNILVTPDGRPKLLDFGIAKFLTPETASAASTRSARWITPAYASPEQIRGEQVSTLTDVYALGILLYELLSGRRPYDVEYLSPAEVERVVCEVEPERMSASLVRPKRTGVTAERLRRQLAGDLDTIALKALAKDPARRYASVEKLSEDIQRHQNGLPVLARPDSFGYRASKFIRRHKPSVIAATVAVVALLGGVAASAWQASVAKRERDRAQQALRQSEDVTSYLVDIFASSDPARGAVDTVAARELLRQGLERAEALRAQPEVQARMFVALGEVYANLGEFDQARGLMERALTIRRTVYGADHVEVAQSMDHLGTLLRRTGEYAQAESLYARALTMKRRVLRADDPEIAETLQLLGFLMPYVGRTAESVQDYREALDLLRSRPGTDTARIAEATLLLAQARRNYGDYAEAEQTYREALALYQRATGPESDGVSVTMVHLGDLLQRQLYRVDEAIALYQKALPIQEELLGDSHPRLVHVLSSLAEALDQQEQWDEAEALLRRTLAIRERTWGLHHSNTAEGLDALASHMFRRGNYQQAESLLRQSIALWRETMGPEHQAVAGTLMMLGRTLAELHRYQEADSVFNETERLRIEASGPHHSNLAVAYTYHALLHVRQRQFEEAERLLQRAEAIVHATIAEEHHHTQWVYEGFVELYDAWGRPDDAARYRAKLIQTPTPVE